MRASRARIVPQVAHPRPRPRGLDAGRKHEHAPGCASQLPAHRRVAGNPRRHTGRRDGRAYRPSPLPPVRPSPIAARPSPAHIANVFGRRQVTLVAHGRVRSPKSTSSTRNFPIL